MYSHRNGETEPPAEHGWYWFNGVLESREATGEQRNSDYCGVKQITILAKIQDDDSGAIEFNIGYERRILFRGQWWGPVTPPWEAQS